MRTYTVLLSIIAHALGVAAVAVVNVVATDQRPEPRRATTFIVVQPIAPAAVPPPVPSSSAAPVPSSSAAPGPSSVVGSPAPSAPPVSLSREISGRVSGFGDWIGDAWGRLSARYDDDRHDRSGWSLLLTWCFLTGLMLWFIADGLRVIVMPLAQMAYMHYYGPSLSGWGIAASIIGAVLATDEAAKGMTPMALSFYGESKRVRNARLKGELGVALRYPTYREGLRALFTSETSPATAAAPR